MNTLLLRSVDSSLSPTVCKPALFPPHPGLAYWLTLFFRWFALGNLMSNVTLKAMAETNPTDWKTPVYTQFGMIGASIIIFFFLPESACTLLSLHLVWPDKTAEY
jgi:hypothetical protein